MRETLKDERKLQMAALINEECHKGNKFPSIQRKVKNVQYFHIYRMSPGRWHSTLESFNVWIDGHHTIFSCRLNELPVLIMQCEKWY